MILSCGGVWSVTIVYWLHMYTTLATLDLNNVHMTMFYILDNIRQYLHTAVRESWAHQKPFCRAGGKSE